MARRFAAIFAAAALTIAPSAAVLAAAPVLSSCAGLTGTRALTPVAVEQAVVAAKTAVLATTQATTSALAAHVITPNTAEKVADYLDAARSAIKAAEAAAVTKDYIGALTKLAEANSAIQNATALVPQH